MTTWWRVDLPYATFGVRVRNGVVVEAAPIASWMRGKKFAEIERWATYRKGSVELLVISTRGTEHD